jgi:Beta-lactamase enzyme family
VIRCGRFAGRRMTSRPLELALEASFEQLSATVPANVGIAIARPDRTYSLGRWSSGVAWSTIKVPLAIAALRNDRSRAQDLVVKAITESDNHASEKLWSQLGEPANAAQRVQAIISESGDTATVVESRRLRRGFTAFGQTQWTLGRQAHFAEQLTSIPDAAAVIDMMHELTVDQRWGLAAKGIAAKAGWGPGVHGDYLVRQFGIVPTQSGQWGVALAAEAYDGVFETGVEVVNALSEWLVSRLPGLARY